MSEINNICETLKLQLGVLSEKTILIEDSSLLDFTNIEDGILIIFAKWSKQSIINCSKTIRILYERNYAEQIVGIDLDCINLDFQTQTFGQVCHGWGEVFTINRGMICKKYFGESSFVNFYADWKK